MGVRHLTDMRNYLKKNSDTYFSNGALQRALLMNYNAINENIEYLMNVEKVIVSKFNNTKKTTEYKWK